VIPKGTRGQGFKGSSEKLRNYKEQKDMEERQPWITLGCFTYLNGSVCELETRILLAGDLDLIEKGELGTLKKDIAENERMFKALIQSLENIPFNP
jgi:hypothetical protein